MNAAAYYRVSSLAQDLGLQQHSIAQAAGARGDEITAVYQEKRTAKELGRPELDRLRKDGQAGGLPPRLYVFRYDRLCRSGIADTLNLIRELRQVGVEVYSVTDGFSFAGPVGEFVIAGLAFGAQLERLAGEERRAAARERRKAAGQGWGRPRKYELHDPLLARAMDMKAEGKSIREIAMALKIKRPTLQRRLVELDKLSQKSPLDLDADLSQQDEPEPPPGP